MRSSHRYWDLLLTCCTSACSYDQANFQRRATNGKRSPRKLPGSVEKLGCLATRIRKFLLYRELARDHGGPGFCAARGEDASARANLSRGGNRSGNLNRLHTVRRDRARGANLGFELRRAHL